jgi:hypothetical protein
MPFVNLTRDEITIHTERGEPIVLPPMADDVNAPWLEGRSWLKSTSEGVIIQATEYYRAVNLPEPRPDTYFIVDAYIAKWVKRHDVVFHDRGGNPKYPLWYHE